VEHLYSLEKEMATHSSVLAWVVPCTFKLPGKLQPASRSKGSITRKSRKVRVTLQEALR